MSKSVVNQVIQRAISDAAFRRQLQRDPGKALVGFDLTQEERVSITSGDPRRLTALGVDQRMSKAFALGAAADASTPINDSAIDNPASAGSQAFIDEGSAAGSNVDEGLVSDTTSGATSVFASDPTSGATHSLTGTDGPQLDAGLVGDTTSGATAVIPGDPTVGATAFEGTDTSGDMNVIDPGLLGSTTGANVWDTDPTTGTMMQDDNSGLTSPTLEDDGSGVPPSSDDARTEF